MMHQGSQPSQPGSQAELGSQALTPGLQYKIRLMDASDIAGIRGLISKDVGVTLLASETDLFLAAAIARNRPGCCVATNADGAIIGCCFGVHDGLRGSFRHVAVDPEFRRKGLGAALLTSGYAYFKQEGISRIIIQVGDANTGAKSFWISQGFRLSSGEKGIVVSMTKDLQ